MTVTSPIRRLVSVDTARAVRPQVTVLAGQLIAGIGNLAFAIVLAHLLPAAEYAAIIAFLALYVLLHAPVVGLTAAGAMAPERLAGLVPRIGLVGAAIGAGLIAAAGPISSVLNLPPGIIVALGVAAPAAALLSAYRGLAYGREQYTRVTGSLVAEPTVRLLAGIPLALTAGAVGAAAGVVLAGYCALAVCAIGTRRAATDVAAASPTRLPISASAPVLAGISFVALAVLQAVDLLVGNRVLDADAAAQFGVLSTLGGAAFFATATIPLVLMPAVARLRAGATGTAMLLTAVVGVGISGIGALFAEPVLQAAFGEQYVGLAPLVGPYLLAMTMLGLVRVQVAASGAVGRGQWACWAIGAAIVIESVVIAVWVRTVPGIATTTFVTSLALLVVVQAPQLAARVRRSGTTGDHPSAWSVRAIWAMVGLCTVAFAVRAPAFRGLWIDEAISVSQAKKPFGQMLTQLAQTDVHPPLHHTILWLTVRAFGTSEFAVRLPSLIAGVALVPVMFWLGRICYNRRTGWVAATLTAVAPFGVWYSQEARMYSLFMLLSAIAVGAQVQAIRQGRQRDWALYAVATSLMMWTQYFAVLPIFVQTCAFAVVFWRRRKDRPRRRNLVSGWLTAAGICIVTMAPIWLILSQQLASYGSRGTGLVPGQAGAGGSSLDGSLSIYSVGANFIWALFGYHADGVMVQIAALWPLVMLLAFIMLGRGRSGVSVLLLSLVMVPMAALFLIGSVKRDLFELRYFSGAVPAMLLLCARVITATTARRVGTVTAAATLTVVLLFGLVDQQVNGTNPRRYDFEGAFAEISAKAQPGDTVLYAPTYLESVFEYYVPELHATPYGSVRPPATGRVWVVATDQVVNDPKTSAELGTQLAHLETDRVLVDSFARPNVRVWELDQP